MKLKLPKSSKKFSQIDPKKRTLLLIVGVVVLVVALTFIYKVWKNSQDVAGGSSMSGTPGIQSVQGGKISPEYMKALQQDNQFQAKQAQMTGGSSVGTIINTGTIQPAAAPATSSSSCTNCCANCDGSVDLDQELSKLVSSGAISPATQELLSNLAKQNVSPEEYAAQLEKLVREGKLTPEQARKLLAAYKSKYDAGIAEQGAKAMDSLIKSGQLPLDAANELLALQKKNVPVSVYAAALQKLVKEGKISSQVAAQLLAQYKKQHQEQLAKQTAGQLNTMLSNGEITHDVAKTLQALQDTGVSVGNYAAALQRLVKQGKISPDVAQRLLDQYKKQHGLSSDDASVSEYNSEMKLSAQAANRLRELQKEDVTVSNFASALQTMVKTNEVAAAIATQILQYYDKEYAAKQAALKSLDESVSAGKLQTSAATDLAQLIRSSAPLSQYTAKVQSEVKAGTIPMQMEGTLINGYQNAALAAQRKDQLLTKLENEKKLPDSAAQTLKNLQDQNVSLADYAAELQKLVKAGLISPQTANALLEAYKAKLGVQSSGSASFDTSVTTTPSSTAFSGSGNASLQRIQRTVANQQAAAAKQKATTQQAQQVNNNQAAAQAQQQYQQAVQQATQKMMTQAQQLMTGTWATTPQTYVASEAKDQSGSGGSGASGAGDKEGKDSGETLVKAGTIMYAVLDTAVNSDYSSSPVMATLVSGKFKGAKLLGKISTGDNDSDRVILEFSTMTMDGWPSGVSIDAYAIDPDTARTAIATSVNHHYMEKYGAQFAASFMQGLGEAIEDSGSSSTSDSGVVTTSTSDLDTTEKFLVALGTVGENIGDDLDSADITTTVKVKAGVGLGILFMTDVSSGNVSSWEASSNKSSTSGGSSGDNGSSGAKR